MEYYIKRQINFSEPWFSSCFLAKDPLPAFYSIYLVSFVYENAKGTLLKTYFLILNGNSGTFLLCPSSLFHVMS